MGLKSMKFSTKELLLEFAPYMGLKR